MAPRHGHNRRRRARARMGRITRKTKNDWTGHMIIIAFSTHTSKILPRILCRNFRHCAPIVPTAHGLVMYQFVRHKHVARIKLRPRDLSILYRHQWRFIFIPVDASPDFYSHIMHVHTCVGLCRAALRHKYRAITPDALYRRIRGCDARRMHKILANAN